MIKLEAELRGVFSVNPKIFADCCMPTNLNLDDYPNGNKPGTKVIMLLDGSEREIDENILRAAIEQYNHEWEKYKEKWLSCY